MVGAGTTGMELVPVQVLGFDGVQLRATAISAGSASTCARVDSGALLCWGPSPTPVPGLDGVGASGSDISVGADHQCVIVAGGEVRCWGSDTRGQVGDGDDNGAAEPLPTPVVGIGSGPLSATQISSGAYFSCALLSSGEPRCWGFGTSGQLGTGHPVMGNETSPVPMGHGRAVVDVRVGNGTACATLDTGAAYCWGADAAGQVGDGSDDQATEYAPAAVALLDGLQARALEVHTSGDTACALLTTGAVMCWGSDATGVLGDGDNGQSSQSAPVQVVGIDGLSQRAIQLTLGVGGGHACALLDTGAVHCWGAHDFGQVGTGVVGEQTYFEPVPVVGLDGSGDRAVRVAAAWRHTCAVLESGEVRCWGSNTGGQLGQAVSFTPEPTPLTVTGLDGVSASAVDVAVGRFHSCAVLVSGAARCWGAVPGGQAGDVAALDGTGDGVVSLGGGSDQACAVTSAGDAFCWGTNSWGGLGTGDANHAVRQAPAPVVGLSAAMNPALRVSVGQLTSCAIAEAPVLQCWGRDTSGQLGDGNDDQADEYTPVRVRFPW
jgi:alpha-tubulin suppressor-like RCC1 family protein